MGSFNGRVGAVQPQSGDYNASQVTNAATTQGDNTMVGKQTMIPTTVTTTAQVLKAANASTGYPSWVTGNATVGAPASTSITATSGDLLIVSTWNSDGGSQVISDTLGSSFTLQCTNNQGGGYTNIWTAPLTASGSDTISTNFGVFEALAVDEYSGANNSTPVQAACVTGYNVNSGGTGITVGPITTTGNALLYTTFGSAGSSSTASSPFTNRQSTAAANKALSTADNTGGAGNPSATWGAISAGRSELASIIAISTAPSPQTADLQQVQNSSSVVQAGIRGGGLPFTVAVPFANLPVACGSGENNGEGTVGAVTDSTTNVIGAVVSGGGGNHVGVYCNGTNWVVTSGSGSGGGANSVQYNASNTAIYLYGDSRMVVSSSCSVSSTPDSTIVTSGSIFGGVLTANTTTNYYLIPDTITLSGFTGAASGLNGQKVPLTSATGSTFVAPVSGITTLASTGTGVSLGCSYNLSGDLRDEPFISGHGTVVNGTIPGLSSSAAISDYSTTAHLYSPIVTGNPGILVLQVGGQDWLSAGWDLSTTEANIQTLLVNARADNWTAIVLTTVIPHSPSLYNNPPSDIIALNAFIRALVKTQDNLSTGYADWIEDAALVLPDPTNATYVIQSGGASGHLTDVGAKKWADDINSNFAAQGSSLLGTPYCGVWSGVPCLNGGNTWGGVQTMTSPVLLGHPDASGATDFKLPVGAGCVTTANGQQCYDSTSGNWHGWVNGADYILLPLANGFVSGHCGQPTKTGNTWFIVDSGASCASGSGAPAPIFGTSDPFGVGAPSVVNHVVGGNTFSATSGNKVVVVWSNWNNNETGQPTLSDTLGTTFTLATSYGNPSLGGYIWVYEGVLTSSGMDAVSATGLSHSGYDVLEVSSLSATIDGSWVSGTSLSPSITTTVVNDLLLSIYKDGGGACQTVTSGWTDDCYRDNGWVNVTLAAQVATSATTYSLTWGGGSPDVVAFLALEASSTPVAGVEGQMYFQTSTSPYTKFIYHAGAWHAL
jgi:hypothetical protein